MDSELLERIKARKFQLAIFDLDGTLIDSVPDLAKSIDFALEHHELPAAGEALVRDWVGNGAPMLVTRALAWATGCTPDELDDQFTQEVYQQFLTYYDQHKVVGTTVYPGVIPLLEHWYDTHGQRQLAIVTNKPSRFTRAICQALSMDHYFKLMYSGDTFSVRKPDPAPLLNACQALQVSPQDAIMVGDSMNDVRAARNAKIPAVCVSYGYNHGEDISAGNPDLLVDSLLELM